MIYTEYGWAAQIIDAKNWRGGAGTVTIKASTGFICEYPFYKLTSPGGIGVILAAIKRIS